MRREAVNPKLTLVVLVVVLVRVVFGRRGMGAVGVKRRKPWLDYTIGSDKMLAVVYSSLTVPRAMVWDDRSQSLVRGQGG